MTTGETLSIYPEFSTVRTLLSAPIKRVLAASVQVSISPEYCHFCHTYIRCHPLTTLYAILIEVALSAAACPLSQTCVSVVVIMRSASAYQRAACSEGWPPIRDVGPGRSPEIPSYLCQCVCVMSGECLSLQHMFSATSATTQLLHTHRTRELG